MAMRLKEENPRVFGETEVQRKGSQEQRLSSPERGDFAMERKMPGHTELPDPKKTLPLHVYYNLVAAGQLNFLTPEEERQEFERIRAFAESIKKDFRPE
jgi:hypothetical protein